MKTSLWRVIAGAAVLAALIAMMAMVAPPYLRNWRFQQYLNELSASPSTAQLTPSALHDRVVDRADRLGLPLTAADVHVTKNGDAFHVDVLYVVHINLPFYAVDLHFRPGV